MQHWLAKENVNAECSTIEINFVHAQQKKSWRREREGECVHVQQQHKYIWAEDLFHLLSLTIIVLGVS